MTTATLERAPRRAPAPYDEFEKILINGKWRQGRGGKASEDRDPYTDEILVRIPVVDDQDVDEA